MGSGAVVHSSRCSSSKTRIEAMPPALAGGHPTTGPPGKPNNYVLIEISEVTIVCMQLKDIEILGTFYSGMPNVSIL